MEQRCLLFYTHAVFLAKEVYNLIIKTNKLTIINVNIKCKWHVYKAARKFCIQQHSA